MQFRLKQFLATSMFTMAGLAQAANVDIPTGTVSPFTGTAYQGALTLSYSAQLLGSLDTMRASVTSFAPGRADVAKDTDGFFTQVSQSSFITSMTVDSTTQNVVRYDSVGGATWKLAPLKSVSSGGTLTLTDLSVDFTNKHVFATIIGGNGVGTINNFHLFDFRDLTGSNTPSCRAFGPCQYPALTISGLYLTSEGFNKFSQSLGLQSLGRATIGEPIDFGVLTVTAVPEPSSYALMGLGLFGVLVAVRRPGSRA